MAKAKDAEKETTWGTWEDLLLASAVNRHGTRCWDSVVMEIQNRSSSLHPLTAQNCKQKFQDLKRRFRDKDDKTDDKDDEFETDDKVDRIPWLDELRKLRVAELRREVQRYDVSIVSLQLKVKRLKEERERSFRTEENSEQKLDLDDSERAGYEAKAGEPNKSSPANVAGKSTPDEESDRENQSFNESNSTDPEGESQKPGEDTQPEPVETDNVKPDPVPSETKPVGEGSCNGSSETIAKDSEALRTDNSLKKIPASDADGSPELWESVAESNGGVYRTKENSDVQSSASLSGKKRRKKESSGGSSGEEPENDEVSPAIQRISVKSEPLVRVLEIIRSHKYGSVFERRLDSQETAKYRSLIRQHMDLETVRAKLAEGRYSSCTLRFFRDLLLLVNNALVFFPKSSAQSVAAHELRDLVSKELVNRTRKTDNPSSEPAQPVQPTAMPGPEVPEPSDPLPARPKPSGPIIVCRKRSSISAKERKVEQRAAVTDDKAVQGGKQIDKSGKDGVVEEQSALKKRTRERSVSGARSSRTGSKSRMNGTNMSKSSNVAGSSQNPSSSLNPGLVDKDEGTPNENTEPKREKKKSNNNNNVTVVGKKRSAANFLNRMKRNSSSNGTLLETLKSSGNSITNNSNSNRGGGGGGGGGSEQKKSGGGGGRGEGRKDQVSRQGSAAKQAQEQGSPVKRSVGRPPKRATATPPAPAKRSREVVETETVSRQPRKRSRR